MVKIFLSAVLLQAIAVPAFGQVSPDQTLVAQANQTPNSTNDAQAQSDTSRSTVEVKPGPPAIKQQDLYEATGVFRPFLRMPKYILQDQKAIWTSPFHTAKGDVKWWAIFGTATTALIATDKWSSRALPNTKGQIAVSTWGSRLGSAYSLIPISASFYFLGTDKHDERFRETGLLGFEALTDTALLGEAVKMVADRARPYEPGGTGRFEDGRSRWNSGFPSGHALSTWALASVIAHQYPHPRIVPIIVYALASTVVVARVGARQHFPGDVVAGSALGWFVGDYVYGRRHNRSLDQKPTISQRILDHIHVGISP